MKIFISWSGERSERVATALATWLPKVIQAVQPWLSSASIDPGARWNAEMTRALEELQYGVLCLTPENISAAWVLFEAGALSKAVSISRVMPYLVGFEPRELQGPLAQFQAVRADLHGTLRLVNAINSADDPPLLSDETLSEAFTVWWPHLAPTLAETNLTPPKQVPTPQRSVESMLGEVLELVRAQSFDTDLRDSIVPWDRQTQVMGRRIGPSIRKLRQARTLTQRELAFRARISPAYMSKIESEQAVPSLSVLMALSAALEVNISFFLGQQGGENNTSEEHPSPGGRGMACME